MNSFLLKDDYTVMKSIKKPVMEKSTGIDVLYFISPKTIGGYDMTDGFNLVMEYLKPVSKKVKIETLTLVDSDYEGDYLRYCLPLNTEVTEEPGEVEINLTYMGVSLDEDGKSHEHICPFAPTYLTIVPISSWFTASDEAMTQLAEIYTANQRQIQALSDLANMLNQNKADDIKLDIESGEIYVVSGTKKLGTGIMLEELANEITEVAGNSEGNVKIQNV